VRLPLPTRLVIAASITAGLLTLVVAVHRAATTSLPPASTLAYLVVFGLLIAGNWVRPLIVYLREESCALDLNEGFFIALVLLVPGPWTVLVFAAAVSVAELLKRRPAVKAVFNVGQVVTAAGIGVAAISAFHLQAGSIGYARIGAAIVGAVTYLVVSANAVAFLLKTLGTRWHESIVDGIDAKMLILLSSISLAVPIVLVVEGRPWFLPVAVVPLLMLRYLGSGHFYAQHDRVRLRGLFETALEVNRSVGSEEATEAVLNAARQMLRSPDATLSADEPDDDSLHSPVDLADRRLWLAVSGRNRAEPFDKADRALLDALASVCAVTLAKSALYEEVERQKEEISVITDNLGEGVCAVNGHGEITFVNPAALHLLGWPRPKATAPECLLQPVSRAIEAAQVITSDDSRFEREDGTYFPVTWTASPIMEGGVASGAVLVFRDMSERKKFEEELARHAFQDALTGLANRRLLLDHLDQALQRSQRSGEPVAVLFCDVDRFKIVNDNLGHQEGDELLKLIGDRLRWLVRPGDTLSRFGGDEFVILLEGVTGNDGPKRVAQSILHALRKPITLSDGHEVIVSMSVGIALSSDGKSRDDLLHDADVAMYRAKSRGRGGQYVVFDVNEMNVRSTKRVEVETALHHALERNEIEVYYQPLVSLADRSIVGAEALVRWNRPSNGVIYPSQFIHLAEESGLILPIGREVLEQACRQARSWYESFGVEMEVGVNLSARQFQQFSLAEEIEEVLSETGINPSKLCLEITESLAMEDVEVTMAILCKLHTLGIRVAIDDFGTGHSSLGYLARFPIDVVKIDQSFVAGIDRDSRKKAIVSAVIALSRAIDSTVVVEGVETLAQLELLRELGCDVAQGFYFARPMPASQFSKLLTSSAHPRPNLRVVSDALVG
jgi:diguanylate cyclase (GGDEF)-like protein/PAS domain S-box-containing protein